MLSFACKNRKIFDLSKCSFKLNQCEILVVNALLELLDNSEDMSCFKVFDITHFARKVDLVLTILFKYSFS